MNVIPYVALFSIITFLSTLVGGLFAVRYKDNFGVLAAFAAGVLIAVSLFDLLPVHLILFKKLLYLLKT